MIRITALGIGLLFNLIVHGQNSASANASASATIIHPVGTGNLGEGGSEVSLDKKIRLFNENDRVLITQSVDLDTLRILNYGSVFDTSVAIDMIEPKKDQQVRACRITVYFN